MNEMQEFKQAVQEMVHKGQRLIQKMQGGQNFGQRSGNYSGNGQGYGQRWQENDQWQDMGERNQMPGWFDPRMW